MSIMQIGGKNDNLAIPVAVNSDGSVFTEREWIASPVNVLDGYALRDANTHYTMTEGTFVDLKPFGLVSLRIVNSTDKDITFALLYDLNKNSTTYLRDVDGNNIKIVAKSGKSMIITPNDMPVLNYIDYLKFNFSAAEAPTSGVITVIAYVKG